MLVIAVLVALMCLFEWVCEHTPIGRRIDAWLDNYRS